MPIDIPSRKSVSRSLQTYIRSELPELDPTPERRSKIGALAKSVASAMHDWYVALKDYADKQPFPQTATGKFLTQGWWRDITKLDPLPASAARGTVVFRGVSGAVIPAQTVLQANGVQFRTETATTVSLQTVNASSLTFDVSRGLAVFQADQPHLLATGISVEISGAAPAEFNGTFTITASGDSEFTYAPTAAPAIQSANGNPVFTAIYGACVVSATDVGELTNISAGGTAAVTGSIVGVDPTALVCFGGLSGGTDVETPEAYRSRVLKALGTDFGMFTGDEIEIVARTVPGVTRVWVKKATLGGTNGVQEGQVKIAFVRDGEVNIFPTSAEVIAVRDKITTLLVPAHTSPDDVFVMSPIARPTNVRLSIVPDTVSMRAAIIDGLRQYFEEQADYEKTVNVVDLHCVARSVIDPVSRTKLTSYSIAEPTIDVTMAANELPTLGTVVFE